MNIFVNIAPKKTEISKQIDEEYECNKCSKTFLAPWALKRHIDNEHIMENDNYTDEGKISKVVAIYGT